MLFMLRFSFSFFLSILLTALYFEHASHCVLLTAGVHYLEYSVATFFRETKKESNTELYVWLL